MNNSGFTLIANSFPFEYYLKNFCGDQTDEPSCSSNQAAIIINSYKKTFPSDIPNQNTINNSTSNNNTDTSTFSTILYNSYI